MAWIVAGKSLIFAILLIVFHISEGAIRACFAGQPISASTDDFGATLSGLQTYAAIFFVVLTTFFALHEASRILGKGALRNLFFRRGAWRFQLVKE